MAYTSIDKPTDYFETKLHNGTGSSKTLAYDFEVDFFWTKKRNDVYGSYIYDSVRGNNKRLQVSQTNAENTAANTISFGNSSGITIGSDSGNYGVNQTQTDGGSAATYVGWGWLAGGSASSNSNGSITSSVSASTTAGFSVVSYTGTGSNATVGHGLGVAPSVVITKNRDLSSGGASNWRVGSTMLGFTKRLNLNTTDSVSTDSTAYNDTDPTSSVFSVGTHGSTNGSTNGIIAYCFAEKKGYSKFGSYTGNGNADGPFVYTGFRPAFVMHKRTDATNNWHISDNKRDTFNPNDLELYPNASSAEYTETDGRDFLSNGFKIRESANWINASGGTYIYMAFAESPFVNSNGVPNNAR